MIIGIDGNEANVGRRVGISEYAFELLSRFSELRIKNLEFRIYLKENPLNDLPKTGENWRYRIIGPKKLWTQIALPIDLYIHKPHPDVFFSPTHYAPRFSPIPTVMSVMDLSYVHFPNLFKQSDLYQLKNWTSYSVRGAKKVITISKTSKNDIIKEYKIPEDRVVVVYPGIKKVSDLDAHIYNMTELKKKFGIDQKYLLFVGTLQPRKNIVRLVEAFSNVAKQSGYRDVQLVIVGKKGWLYNDILSAPKKYGVNEKVLFLEFVTDQDLVQLYHHALCFILPSLYEGFGLPVLEAMKYGCPVITSNVSSLPEAGGDAALYVDPENTEDITQKILMILQDEKLRKKLIEKGKKHIEKFSWEKSAQETLKVLENVVKRD